MQRPVCGGRVAEIRLNVPVVWLVSYPRSGNTFVRQVLWECFGIPSLTVYGGEEQTRQYGGRLGESERLRAPALFIKSHSIQEYSGKVWHIVRDGRDAYLSFRKLNEDRSVGIRTWGQFITAMEPRADLSTRYEDMLSSPKRTVSDALTQLGIEHTDTGRQPTEFAELHERDPEFWRRGVRGAWRDELDNREEFEKANAVALAQLGYT